MRALFLEMEGSSQLGSAIFLSLSYFFPHATIWFLSFASKGAAMASTQQLGISKILFHKVSRTF